LKLKRLFIFLIGLIVSFIGANDVSASKLVREQVPDVYYARIDQYNYYGTGAYERLRLDGKTVYCIEAGKKITTSDYIGTEGWIESPFSQEINQKIQLIGYYGYDYPNHNTVRYEMATQALIWEVTSGKTIEYWTILGSSGDYIDVSYEKNEIMKLVNVHYEVPSFNNKIKQVSIGNAVTFIDNNNILSQFEVYDSTNSIASINGNTLTIVPNVVGDVNVILTRKMYEYNKSIIFVGEDKVSQKVGYFRVNDPVVASVKVKSIGGKVSIEKYDSTTNLLKPLGDAKLSGAVYGIYNLDNIKIGEITTNENASGISDYLPSLGKYYLKEEKASYGYKLDDTKYYFEITDDNLNPIIKVYEDVISRDVTFFKIYANGSTGFLVGEANIEFEFYLKSTNELYTTAVTNSEGYLIVEDLPFGTYVVHQKNSTHNYEKVEDFEITIDKENDEPLYKLISNAEITAKLKVNKIDSDTGKSIAMSGIKFKIFDNNRNEYVCQNVTYPTATKLCVFETDSNGVLITPYPLNNGKYLLEEVDQRIDGYLWNKESLEFEIGENSEFINDKDYGTILEVSFKNKPVKGEFELTKIGEDFVINNNSFSYEEIMLDDVTYDLYADGDIYSQDGTLIYKDKELISTFKTINGKYKMSNLYLGNYCLVETNSVSNHIVDKTPYCLSIKYKDQYTDIVSLSFTLKNYLPKGTLEFTKTDLVNGDVIPNTLIEIYTSNDELVFSGKTNNDGKIIINNLLVGKYYIIEKEPATGYVINNEKVEFEILEDGSIIKAEMTNKPITGTLEFTKLDLSTNEALPNTLIQIYTEGDVLVFEGRTDENGMIIISELQYGKYYIIEKEAPEGYILNEDKMFFEILEDGSIIKANMVNEKIIIDVPVTGISDSKFVTILTIASIVAGIVFIIYDKKRKK